MKHGGRVNDIGSHLEGPGRAAQLGFVAKVASREIGVAGYQAGERQRAVVLPANGGPDVLFSAVNAFPAHFVRPGTFLPRGGIGSVEVDHKLVFRQVFRYGVVEVQAFLRGGVHEVYLDSPDSRFGE